MAGVGYCVWGVQVTGLQYMYVAKNSLRKPCEVFMTFRQTTLVVNVCLYTFVKDSYMYIHVCEASSQLYEGYFT